MLLKAVDPEVGNTGSFSHFCKNQPVPDEVKNI